MECLPRIATFTMESLQYDWMDGEISWMISRDDLRAGRFPTKAALHRLG